MVRERGNAGRRFSLLRSSLSVLLTATVCSAFAYDTIKLPSTAQPMAAAQLQKAYAGKSISFPDGSQVFWGPDGNAKGFFRKYQAIGDGTWDATDGRVCNHITWRGLNAKPGEKPKTINNCWRYMADGEHVFHQFTSDTLKSDDGWWVGPSDLTKLKPGNTLAAQYNAVKAKMH